MKNPDDFLFDIIYIKRSDKTELEKVLEFRELLSEYDEYMNYVSAWIIQSIPDDPREFREVH